MEQNHMPPEQPPAYSQSQSHDPQTLQFPPVPTADLGPIHNERTLPPLPAAPPADARKPEPVVADFGWPSSNPLTAYYQPGPAHISPKNKTVADSPGAMEMDTPEYRGRRGGSVLSMDDPDVRLAAEALGDLRADFIQSPPQTNATLPPLSSQSSQAAPEPLLSLLTTSHPLLGTAIGGSLSAYSASKNYSPRFRSGAEYVERRTTPFVNTLGSVGRLTGVEGGVRWFLGDRRPSHHKPSEAEESLEGSNKRRKVLPDDRDDELDRNAAYDAYPVARQESRSRPRRSSLASTVDSLPAYDDHRSPSYEATQQALIQTQGSEITSQPSSWHQRLVLSTSGLSVAMSEESLRSLKYCLSWLRWANEHIGKVILALKSVLETYVPRPESAITDGENLHPGQLVVRTESERSELHAKIAALKSDVLKTLKDVVDIVSKYAGGALPDNARLLVRRHLTSLPQRFKLASSAQSGQPGEGGDRELTDGANRVMVLAKEGLDMMAQVSGVLDGTIVSAEEWCERLGRSKREERDEDCSPMTVRPSGQNWGVVGQDVKLS